MLVIRPYIWVDTEAEEEKMSILDKIKNRLQAARGKTKQATGRAGGRPTTEMRGRRNQVRADLKDAGEQVKDAAGKVKKSFKR
jgi:uncharacterized protein YjbJ (UPF0337 family)